MFYIISHPNFFASQYTLYIFSMPEKCIYLFLKCGISLYGYLLFLTLDGHLGYFLFLPSPHPLQLFLQNLCIQSGAKVGVQLFI